MKVPVLKNIHQAPIVGRFSAKALGAFRSLLPTRFVDVATCGLIGFLSLYFFRPLNEPDFYWHIIVGEGIVKRGDFGANTLQTWGTFDPSWMTTQGLSEVLMYLIWSESGKSGIALVRLSLWLYLIYWFLKTFRFGVGDSKKSVIIGKWIALSLGLIISFGFIQERPAAISIFLTTVVFQDLVRLLVDERNRIKRRTFLIFTIWPLFHPGWILPYALVLMILLRRALGKGVSRIVRSYLELSFLVIPIIPLLMPTGQNYYETLLTISSRGHRWISEWQPIWKLPLTSIILWLVAVYVSITLVLLLRHYALWSQDLILTLSIVAILIIATVFAIRNAIYLVLFLAALSNGVDQVGDRKEIISNTEVKKAFIPQSIKTLSTIPLLFLLITLFYCTKLSLDAGLEKQRSDIERVISDAKMNRKGPVKIINSPNYGGQIHYLMGSEGIPLIDGRVDRYSDELQWNIDQFFFTKSGWKDVFGKEFSQACAVLLKKDDKIRSKITSLGFTLKSRKGKFYWYERDC